METIVPEIVTTPTPEAPKQEKLPRPGALIKEAFAVYKKNIPLFLGIIVLFVLSLFIVFIPGSILMTLHMPIVLKVLIAIVVFAACMYIVFIGISALIKSIAVTSDGGTISIKQAYKEASKKVFVVGATLLLFYAIVVGGTILLVIPGLIFVVWYGKCVYVALLEDATPFQAVKKSRAYLRGRFWAVVGRAIVIMLVGLAVSIILSVILTFILGKGQSLEIAQKTIFDIFWVPFQMIYSYLIYKHLKNTYIEKPVK